MALQLNPAAGDNGVESGRRLGGGLAAERQAGQTMANTASMFFCSQLIAVLLAGCGSKDVPAACRDPGTPHDETVHVVVPQYPTESQLCFGGGGDCSSLCAQLAQLHGTGGRVTVEVCERLLPDGGDVPDDAAASDGTIHIVYRTFPFCGT
jgi:hypothetical protein